METITTLRDRYTALKQEEPRLRIRDAATRLEVGEAELVALDCGNSVTRLDISDWHSFIRALKPLGKVMVLTRNEFCVHEKTGEYEFIPESGAHVGLVTGKDIDLRLFYKSWDSAFAVEIENPRGGMMRSFQFFDSAGTAIHKVYLRNEEGLNEFRSLTERFRAEDQGDSQVTAPLSKSSSDIEPTEETKEALIADWSALEDTHQFFMLLRKHKISRLNAIQVAEGHFTQRVGNDAAAKILEGAAEKGAPIMVFVGNEGAIQIHTGPVQKTARMGDWMNVMDPGFNLHLLESGIATSWIVEKPTKDGTVTSLEVLDQEGETIVQFFGERKPGKPEREDWRDLLADLIAEQA
ncbi:hemin-degrading factor [Puniceicoccus vermicola]|uniref:Hemin-degrading factor n=1 Tax=Puniceicoccus vermicola TaxID=388746 RepID=A0A7X1AX40_9BACT|nr:ChuX/HutX family heme-like substrate-binding protein [Puniceicoccus vermicola]MBC2601514.1 hemin-degrading factor [Puniceicoccus vermicola]